jgi:hypothetical protein
VLRAWTFRNAALWLIALALFTTIFLDHIAPALTLAMNRQRYQDAARDCHDARSYLHQAAAIAATLEDEKEFADALRRTAAVAAMGCYDRNVLRAYLLGSGVDIHVLDQLDLEAKLRSGASLTYFSGTVGE